MLCEKCQERPANVHITKIVNGIKQEHHFCEQCAQTQKINMELPQIPIQNISNLLGLFLPQASFVDSVGSDKVCPNCKTPYNKIIELGFVGCSECYENYNSQLEMVIRKIHGSSCHHGKIPRRMGGSLMLQREIDELKTKLRLYVEQEKYEEAAQIRDKIKELEQRIKGGR